MSENVLHDTGHGRYELPFGRFMLDQTLTLDKPATIVGHGVSPVGGSSPTVLVGDVVVASVGVTLQGFAILGNLTVQGSRCNMTDLNVYDSATDGITLGGTGSANLWRMTNVMARGNTGHGVILDDAEGDANGGICNSLDVANNGGDGLRVARAEVNTFLGVVAQANTGAGVRLASGAKNNTVINPHSEANTGGQAVCDSGSVNNLLAGSMNFTPTDNGNNTVMRAAGGSNQQLTLDDKLSVGGKTLVFNADNTVTWQ